MTSPWARLVGHAPQRRLWLAMRRAGRLPHALLLTGPAGIGKRAWALASAQDLLCLEPKPDGPCGRCASCRAISHQAHPDLLEAGPEKGHRELRAEEVGPLMDWLALTPALGRRKALILDQAEAATRPTAPAFLKAFEEPPEGTHVFLVTDRPRAMVPTIVSRCRRLAFAPLDREAFLEVMDGKARGAPADTLHRLSRGSPGQALRMLEGGLLDLREGLLGLLDAPQARALELAAKTLVPPRPSGREAAEQEATPTEIRRREALDRLQLMISLLRDRMPSLPAEARLHPDLALPASPVPLDRQIRAAGTAMDSILGNTDLTLALECFALELAREP